MNQSIAFYQGVLGMTKYYDDEITLSGDLLPGGADGRLPYFAKELTTLKA